MEFANEYTVLKESKKIGCKNLLMLDAVLINNCYIALRLEKYEMTLREYLHYNRNSDELNEILLATIQGIRELHELGFVHRDLKPENIMVSLAPISVAVIDFNRV